MVTLHLVLLAFWAGVVATESVMEIAGRLRPALAPAVTVFHFWIDLTVELPLLAGVVATGLSLVWHRVLDATLALKIGCGLAAVLANLVCVALVVARYRGANARRTTRAIFVSALVGLPAAAAALVLGARYAGWIG